MSYDDEPAEKRPAFDLQTAQRLFARVAGSSTSSYRQLVSDELSEFHNYLNPSYNAPSRQTLVTNIAKEATRAKDMIAGLLKNAPMVRNVLLYEK